MPTYNNPYGWWGGKWHPPTPMSVVQILDSGSMDARLLATCWLTVERRGSVLIAADPMQDAGKTTTLTAMLDFVPAEHWIYFPHGWYETWDFLKDEGLAPDETVIAINEWSDHLASYMWGPNIRRCFDLMERGYTVLTAMHDDTVEGVLEQLRDDVGIPTRQLGHMTLVIILRLVRMGGRIHRRMATMHYLEPDGDGVPRILPAMRWDPMTDTHAHFDAAEALGPRLGMTVGECREELERRAAFLTGLSSEGIRQVGQVRHALATYRRASLTGEDLPIEIGGDPAPDDRDEVWGER
jgi:hypothetical protein